MAQENDGCLKFQVLEEEKKKNAFPSVTVSPIMVLSKVLTGHQCFYRFSTKSKALYFFLLHLIHRSPLDSLVQIKNMDQGGLAKQKYHQF